MIHRQGTGADSLPARRRRRHSPVSEDAAGPWQQRRIRAVRQRGYEVSRSTPTPTRSKAIRFYHDLRDIPEGVDAVVIATAPERAEATIRECAELGIRHACMHRSFGDGSVCDHATAYGREHGITVIDGGCPLMFEPTADVAHKVLRLVCTHRGHMPRTVP